MSILIFNAFEDCQPEEDVITRSQSFSFPHKLAIGKRTPSYLTALSLTSR
jgi:hypothetical protein